MELVRSEPAAGPAAPGRRRLHGPCPGSGGQPSAYERRHTLSSSAEQRL